MIFFPAIDIYEGFCVRLEKGDFEKKTIFNKNPLDQAKIFQDMGCDWTVSYTHLTLPTKRIV